MSPQVRSKLEKISKMTDENLSVVIRRSLAVYEALLEQQSAGAKILLQSKDGDVTELMLL